MIKNTLTVLAILLSMIGILVSLAREELRCRLGLAAECTSRPSRPVVSGPSLEASPPSKGEELKPEPSPPSAEASMPSEMPSPLPSPDSTPTPDIEPMPSASPTEAPPTVESSPSHPETAIPIPVPSPSPDT